MNDINTRTFFYVDSIQGVCAVTLTVLPGGHGIMTKNGHPIPLDSPEAEPLLARWARLELGLK